MSWQRPYHSFRGQLLGAAGGDYAQRADYITLDSLNIDATNAGAPGTYGWGLHLTNQADNNIVRGCTVTSSETSTSSNFAGIVVSGSTTSATTGGQFTIAATALLATKAQTNSPALSIFPNPSSSGQLTLQVARPLGTGTVELLNALGQVVRRQPLAAGEQTVTTTGLAAGLYTLRVQAGAEVLTRKVVLQ